MWLVLLTNAAIGIAFAVYGGIVAAQRPSNPVGWLLLGAGFAPLTSAAVSPAMSSRSPPIASLLRH